MIANKYKICSGVGISPNKLPSFDKALIDAGVGNYNLVRLSSILPSGCKITDVIDLKEGSLLPTAYSTVSSNKNGDYLVSSIGVGLPEDESLVGVIMEHSTVNVPKKDTINELVGMIKEAFKARNWKLDRIVYRIADKYVEGDSEYVTTFACIAEW